MTWNRLPVGAYNAQDGFYAKGSEDGFISEVGLDGFLAHRAGAWYSMPPNTSSLSILSPGDGWYSEITSGLGAITDPGSLGVYVESGELGIIEDTETVMDSGWYSL